MRALALAFAICIAGTGCGSESDLTITVRSTATPMLTSDGSTTVPSVLPVGFQGAQLYVVISSVTVKIHDNGHGQSGKDNKNNKDDKGNKNNEDADQDIVVFSGSHEVDLFDDAATEAFLANVVVPSGPVKDVRIVLGARPVLHADGRSTPVTCPQCTAAGLVVVSDGTIVVPSGGQLAMVLDFQRESSFEETRDGLLLHPQIQVRSK